MKNKLLILYFIFFSVIGFPQNLKDNIQNNLYKVQTITSSDTNFYDLAPLRNAIGNSRVVMLGEQDHGDAPTFLAKTRIVKYLHEEMGFDVIAFESDFFGLNQKLLSINEIKDNIYPIWTKCSQTQDLFKYVDKQSLTNHELIVTGFDCRHSMKYSKNNYVKDFDSLLSKTKISFYNSPNYNLFKILLIDVIENEYQSKTDKNQQNFFLNSLDSIQFQLSQIQFSNRFFWLQEILNLKGHAKNAWENGMNMRNYNRNIRDKQMGENLLWLILKKYPNKKIIVWAHNIHIAKDINQIKHNKKEKSNKITAGNIVYKKIGNQMYSLGFTSFNGKTRRVTSNQVPYRIPKPKKNSFEKWIKESKLEYAFINFKDFSNKSIFFKMKGLGHYQKKANWMEIFDGIFYIEKMYECEVMK